MAKKKTSKSSGVKKFVAKKSTGVTTEKATLIVKIISIFGYVGAALGILIGLMFLFGGPLIAGLLPLAEMPEIPAALLGTLITVMGVVMIVLSIFWIFVSRAVWAYKNWARIVFLVFAVLGVINGIISIPSGILGIVLNGLIVYFLGFDKTVMGLFK